MIVDFILGINELIRRASKLTGRFFCYRSLPRERREAIRLIRDIFKYGTCPGFESLYNSIFFGDYAYPDEKAKTDSESFGKRISIFHKNDIHLIRLVNKIGLSDTLRCVITTGMLMWSILIMIAEIVKKKEVGW